MSDLSSEGNVGRAAQQASLAQALKRLRRRARISQRTLARLSSIAFTTVQGIEDERRQGKAVQPNPGTLRLLALGIASDPNEPGTVDRAQAARSYETLMRAAGYLDGIPSAIGPGAGKLVSALAELLGEGQLVELARLLPKLDQDDRAFLRRSLQSDLEYLQGSLAKRTRLPGPPPSSPPSSPPTRRADDRAKNGAEPASASVL